MADRTARKTLWSHGRKGSTDWMRVLVNKLEDRVEFKYKNAAGQPRKKVFHNTKDGKRAAIVFAEGYRDEWLRTGSPHVETTHGDLWLAYTASPAWQHDLRDTSKPSYTDRWRKWVNFRGDKTRVDETTLHHIDQYVMAAQAAGTAINQVRQVLNLARVVYNWGQTRKLVRENVFVGWRWKTPKDAIVNEPAEYSDAEYTKLLLALSPQSSRTWRAWVALMIAGHHGGRAHAVLNLTWPPPIADGEITWPAAFQKNGKELVQPLTWDLIAAIETARYWRRKMLYRGRWLIPGGTHSSRGQELELDEWMKDPKHKRVGVGKSRAIVDQPYSYQGMWQAIRNAEDRAKVPHLAYRLLHGVRKMVAGNIAERTGNVGLAMRFIGDDIRQAPAYLKQRDPEMELAARAAGSQDGKE